jgi:hypothetical protein
MASPFPGMDPYLEPNWRDVHASLVVYASDALQDQLPPDLRARLDKRVVDVPEEPCTFSPRLLAVEFPPPDQPGPLIVDAYPDRVTESFIKIIDLSRDGRIVTIVEVLTPATKLPGPDRQLYVRKQQELVGSDTNLVEIDLLRQGRHVAAVPLAYIPTPRRTPYMVCVRRATHSTGPRSTSSPSSSRCRHSRFPFGRRMPMCSSTSRR